MTHEQFKMLIEQPVSEMNRLGEKDNLYYLFAKDREKTILYTMQLVLENPALARQYFNAKNENRS